MQDFLTASEEACCRVLSLIRRGRYNSLLAEWQHPERTAERFKDLVVALKDELLLSCPGGGLLRHEKAVEGLGIMRLYVHQRAVGDVWELSTARFTVAIGTEREGLPARVERMQFIPVSDSSLIFSTSVEWPDARAGAGNIRYQMGHMGPAIIFSREWGAWTFYEDGRRGVEHRGKLIVTEESLLQGEVTIYDLEVIEAKVRVMAEVLTLPRG